MGQPAQKIEPIELPSISYAILAYWHSKIHFIDEDAEHGVFFPIPLAEMQTLSLFDARSYPRECAGKLVKMNMTITTYHLPTDRYVFAPTMAEVIAQIDEHLRPFIFGFRIAQYKLVNKRYKATIELYVRP